MDFIESNGVALRCELTGSGDRTLVLVHEMGGSLESWDDVAPRFAGKRRVLRYDTRGAGLSLDPPARKRWMVKPGASANPACMAIFASPGWPSCASTAARRKCPMGWFGFASMLRRIHAAASASA